MGDDLSHLFDGRVVTKDGRAFPVHRVLLATRSSYFRRLLCAEGLDAHQDIRVPDISGDVMDVVVRYIYTGQLTTGGLSPDVLAAAFLLGMEDLFQSCRSSALANLTTSTCVPLLLSAMAIGDCDLARTCVRHAVVHFEKVLQDPGSRIQDLGLETLKKILSLDNLNVSSERAVWSAIDLWISEDPADRRKHLADLLSCVRLNEAESELADTIQNHPHVAGCSPMASSDSSRFAAAGDTRLEYSCSFWPREEEDGQRSKNLDFSRATKDGHNCLHGTEDGQNSPHGTEDGQNSPNGTEDGQGSSNMNQPINGPEHNSFTHPTENDSRSPRLDLIDQVTTARSSPCGRPRVPDEVLFVTKSVVDLTDYSEGARAFVTFDCRLDFWRPVAHRSSFSPSFVLHVAGSSLVALFDTEWDVALTFDLASETWAALPPPPTHRTEYSVVALGRCALALGGLEPQDVFAASTAVERFDFDAGAWDHLRPLPCELSCLSAVTLDGRIYVVGCSASRPGRELRLLAYDPASDAWTPLRPPPTSRRLSALAAHQGVLVLAGGNAGSAFLKTVEAYDPAADTWSELEPLPFAYFLPRAAVVRGVLHVYDGHGDGVQDFRCPPVRYDEQSPRWMVVEPSSPFCDLHLYLFCAVRDGAAIARMRERNRGADVEWRSSPFARCA